jgi:hypothetical protein
LGAAAAMPSLSALTVVQTPTASVVMTVVITLSKYDDEQTPTASLVMMVVITISNDDDADTDR